MKHLSTILASVSLSINAAFGVGAYVIYEKTKALLDSPEEFVTEIVKEQLKAKASAKLQAKKDELKEKLPIPKNIPGIKLF